MTIERKKALLVIFATLLAGILIGALGQAMLARRYHREGDDRRYGHKDHTRHKDQRNHLRNRFTEKIFEVTNATEEQQKQLRPVLEKTGAQIDSLRTASEQQIKTLVKGMMTDITPLLTPEQTDDLQKFFEKIGRQRHKK